MSEDLTCPVCQDVFQDPRFLPCHHVYCKQCIQQLVTRAAPSRTYSCPECRASVRVDDPLPPAHIMNRMKELVGNATREVEIVPPQDNITCASHHYQLDRYCRDCGKVVCAECCGQYGSHQRHTHESLSRAAGTFRASALREIASLRQQRRELDGTRTKIAERKREIQKRTSDAEQQVVRSFELMMAAVLRRKEELIMAINDVAREDEAPLAIREQKLGAAMRAIDDVLVAEDQIKAASDQELLTDFEPIVAASARAKGLIEATALPALTNIVVEVDGVSEVKAICSQKCCVKCYMPIEVVVSKNTAEVGKPSVFSFAFPKPIRVSSITSELISVADKVRTHIDFCEGIGGQFMCTYYPERRGHHHLHIVINGYPVVGSPFHVLATSLSQINKPIRVLALGLLCPIALCFNSKKEVFVSEYDKNQVTALDRNGTPLKGLGITWVDHPWGVAVDENDNIIISESTMDRVSKFTSDGRQLVTIGGSGSRPGEFRSPAGLVVTMETICVCDIGNNRIQVFDRSMKFMYVITPARGKVLGCVAAPPRGELYVATSSGVEVFTLDKEKGTFLRLMRHGDLTSPGAVHFDTVNRTLHVMDYNFKGIFIFKPDGEFITKKMLGIGSCYGMVSDENGYLYVCDSSSGVIQVF